MLHKVVRSTGFVLLVVHGMMAVFVRESQQSELKTGDQHGGNTQNEHLVPRTQLDYHQMNLIDAGDQGEREVARKRRERVGRNRRQSALRPRETPRKFSVGWWYTGHDFPHPTRELKACGMGGSENEDEMNLICNPNAGISREQADTLQKKAQQIWKDTTCSCPDCSNSDGGFTVTIAIPHHIFGPDVTAQQAIDIFTTNLAKDYWSDLGQCGDNVVIGVSVLTGRFHTAAGDVASSWLDENCTAVVADIVRHWFDNGRIYDGLNEMLYYYGKALKGEQCGVTDLSSGQVAAIVLGTILGFLLLVYLLVCLGYCCGSDFILGTPLGECAKCGLLFLQSWVNCCCVRCFGGLFKSCCPNCACREVQCVWGDEELNPSEDISGPPTEPASEMDPYSFANENY